MFLLARSKLADALRVSSSEPIAPARQLVSIHPDSDSIRNTAKRLSRFIIGNLYDFDMCIVDPTACEYAKRIDSVVAALYSEKHRTMEESRTVAHVSARVVKELLLRSEDNDTGVDHPCADVFRLRVAQAVTKVLLQEWEKYVQSSVPLLKLDKLRSASVVYADLVAVGVIGIDTFLSTLRHIESTAIPARGLQAALLITTDLMSRASTVPAGSPTIPREAWTSLLQSLKPLKKAPVSEDLEVLMDFARAFECTDINTGVLDWSQGVPAGGQLAIQLHGVCEELWKLASSTVV
jgi:hypothetical protein